MCLAKFNTFYFSLSIVVWISSYLSTPNIDEDFDTTDSKFEI